MNRFRCIAACSAGLLALAFVSGTSFADEGKSGTIKGTVKLNGPPPKSMAIQMSADPFCAKQHTKPVNPQGKMVFSDGTLPYAFVYIKSGLTGKFEAPKEPVEIDQEGCMYKPHVLGMQAGQPILIKNNDATNHNIHALPKKNPQFNFSQPQKGMTKTLAAKDTFNKPEVMVKIKCDVHPWMSCYVGVVDHPFFAVSGKGGSFEIKDVPAGKYELAVWHEEWGEAKADVEVKEGGSAEVTVEFKKEKAEAEKNVREVSVASVGG